METLGDRLRKLRKEKKLTQAFLAKASGVSPASITQWEQDANHPRGENLMGLANALNCDPNWLLIGDEKTYKPSITDNLHHLQESRARYQISANYIELDFYNVEVSAGHGALVMSEEKDDSIVFSSRFIHKELGVNPKNVFLMLVKGDSMTPTLKNKAMVMVNKIEEFSGDGIYVFRFDGQLMVKRLQFTKRGLNVVSDNQTIYPSWELTRSELKTEDFEILGEVIWSGQRM